MDFETARLAGPSSTCISCTLHIISVNLLPKIIKDNKGELELLWKHSTGQIARVKVIDVEKEKRGLAMSLTWNESQTQFMAHHSDGDNSQDDNVWEESQIQSSNQSLGSQYCLRVHSQPETSLCIVNANNKVLFGASLETGKWHEKWTNLVLDFGTAKIEARGKKVIFFDHSSERLTDGFRQSEKSRSGSKTKKARNAQKSDQLVDKIYDEVNKNEIRNTPHDSRRRNENKSSLTQNLASRFLSPSYMNNGTPPLTRSNVDYQGANSPDELGIITQSSFRSVNVSNKRPVDDVDALLDAVKTERLRLAADYQTLQAEHLILQGQTAHLINSIKAYYERKLERRREIYESQIEQLVGRHNKQTQETSQFVGCLMEEVTTIQNKEAKRAGESQEQVFSLLSQVNQLKRVNTEIERLKKISESDCLEYQFTALQREEEIKILNNEIAKKNKKLSEAQSLLESLSYRLESAQQLVGQYSRKIDSLGRKCELQVNTIRQYMLIQEKSDHYCQQLKRHIEQQRVSIEKAHRKIQLQEQESEEAKMVIETLQLELVNSQKQLKEQIQKVVQQQKSINELNSQSSFLRQLSESLEDQRNRLKQQLISFKDQLISCKDQLAETKTELSQKTSSLQAAINTLNDSKQAQSCVNEKYAHLQFNYNQLILSHSQLQEYYVKEQSNHQEIIKQYEGDYHQLLAARNEMESAYVYEVERLKTLMGKSIEETCTNYEQEIKNIVDQNKRQSVSIRGNDQNIGDFQKATLIAQNIELKSSLDECNHQKSLLKMMIKRMQQQASLKLDIATPPQRKESTRKPSFIQDRSQQSFINRLEASNSNFEITSNPQGSASQQISNFRSPSPKVDYENSYDLTNLRPFLSITKPKPSLYRELQSEHKSESLLSSVEIPGKRQSQRHNDKSVRLQVATSPQILEDPGEFSTIRHSQPFNSPNSIRLLGVTQSSRNRPITVDPSFMWSDNQIGHNVYTEQQVGDKIAMNHSRISLIHQAELLKTQLMTLEQSLKMRNAELQIISTKKEELESQLSKLKLKDHGNQKMFESELDKLKNQIKQEKCSRKDETEESNKFKKNIQTEKALLKNELERQTQLIKDLQFKFQNSQAEKIKFSMKLVSSEEQCHRLQSQLRNSNVISSHAALQVNYQQLKAKMAAMNHNLASLRNQKDGLHQKLINTQQKLQKTKMSLLHESQSCRKFESELQLLNYNQNRLKKEISELESELVTVKDKNRASESENKTLERRCMEIQFERARFREECEKIRAERARLQSEKAIQERQSKYLSSQLARKEASYQDYQLRLKEFSDKYQAIINRKIGEQQLLKDRLEGDKRLQEEVIACLQSKVMEGAACHKDEVENLGKKIDQYQKIITSLKMELKQTKEQFVYDRISVESNKVKKNEFQRMKGIAERQIKLLKKRITDKEAIYQEQKTIIDELKLSISQLKQQIKAQKNLTQAALKSMNQLQAKHNELQVERTTERFKSQTATFQVIKIQHLQQQVKIQAKELQDAYQQLRSLRVNIGRFEQMNHQNSQEINRIVEQERNKQRQLLTNGFKQREAQLQSRIQMKDNLKIDLNNALSERDRMADKLKKSEHAYEELQRQLQSMLAKAVPEQEFQKKKARIVDLEEQVNKLQREIKVFHQNMEDLIDEAANDHKKQQNKSKTALINLQKQLEKAQSQLREEKAAKQAILSEKEQLLASKTVYKSELQSQRQQNIVAERDLEKMKWRCQRQQAQLSNLQQKYQLREKQLERLRIAHETQMASMKQKKVVMGAQSESVNNELQKCTSERNRLLSENSQYDRAVRRLLADNRQLATKYSQLIAKHNQLLYSNQESYTKFKPKQGESFSKGQSSRITYGTDKA